MLIVAHQHLLPSIVPFLDRVASYVETPSNVLLLGKPYSTVPEVEKELQRKGFDVIPAVNYPRSIGEYRKGIGSLLDALWTRVSHRITDGSDSKELLLLDEGGWLISSMPSSLRPRILACIEQTASGIRNNPAHVPVISVAESAAKRHFESPFIAGAIYRKLRALGLLDRGVRVGVIGCGFLGSAVASILQAEGYAVHIYDSKSREALGASDSVNQLLAESDLVLGCAGKDVLDPDVDLKGLSGEKVFASCSSGDVEFNRLIRSIKPVSVVRDNPFATINGEANNGDLKISVVNGGFPMNFDRETEWERREDIELTRDLMVAAVDQVFAGPEMEGTIMLAPDRQYQITKAWLRRNGYGANLNAEFEDPNWWIKRSGGRKSAMQQLEGTDE